MHHTFLYILFLGLFFSTNNKVLANDITSGVKLDSVVSSTEAKLKQVQYYTGIADYPKAYDQIWEVLALANSIQNHELTYKAYKQLSMLYSIFHQKKKAIESIDSMFYYAQKTTNSHSLEHKGKLHFTAALTYRMNEQFDLAQKELRICEQIQDSLQTPMDERIFVLAEKAHLNTINGYFSEAENLLAEISNHTSVENAYSSILYSMWGDLYAKKGEKKKALKFYEQSLDAISLNKTRIGLKVELLEKASELNFELGDYQAAFLQMTESKKLGDQLFGSQSKQNLHLLEIKDSYRKALVEHQKVEKAQAFQLLETEKEKLQQQLIFSLLLICITIFASFYIISLVRKKHLLQQKYVEEQAKKDLEVKKKELTVTALQLIEKDKLLDEIKLRLEKIQTEKDYTSVERIRSTINVNTTRTWDEFEARFVQVNTKFYASLNEKHPNLSPNERKLCALIKLNFSSKEMAELLGVTAESINKARYRLRKKLGLNRDDNLVIYIENI
ncbi:helix-turn-helix transcriptional regulator [Sediminitomix flava]|uniref:DNA-binding CsgD family transcriptional regulator n=1 Tax=Sediminitomix flava TaxID=379075 RepID=A0A315ZSU6_SEDFL|nr:hypothetical protein [Sediminitomix flava]PWJ37930.1 DNA-binding CsgD family transcriptional regulator [Sediminitomix flava]